MHRPPAVSFQVSRSRWHARMLSAGVLLAAVSLCVLAWSVAAEFPAWAVWVQAFLVLLTAASAAWAWHRSPVGTLRWDGEYWLWGTSQEASPVSGLRMVFDFQRLVLVSLRRTGPYPLFLWLEPVRGAPPHAWLALRRALVHSTAHGVQVPSQAADPQGLLS